MDSRILELEKKVDDQAERIAILEDQIKIVMAGLQGLDRRTVGMVTFGGPLNRGPR